MLAPLSRIFAARANRQQLASGLWAPSHWLAENRSGRLHLDGVDLCTLVNEAGSPVMAVSRRKLLHDADRFSRAVNAAFPESLQTCSYKTNCIPGVLKELHNSGFGAEVISPYELWLAAKLQVPGDRIIVNGVNKDAQFIDHAVRLNVASINIDEPTEVDLIRHAAQSNNTRARVSLRLRLDVNSHFGLSVDSDEAAQVAARIANDPTHFEFCGLHFHLLADNDDPLPHIAYLNQALAFARNIQTRFNLVTRNLNIGGGYTVPTMKVMSRLEYGRQRFLQVPCRPPNPDAGISLKRYMQQLADELQASCATLHLTVPRIIVEPGRVITSQSHVLLSKVHAIKSNGTGPDIAMTDAGKILTSFPCDYEYHQMFVANRMAESPNCVYHLMGRLCTSADWLARFRTLPRLQRDDVIAIMDAGAYFTSYASNFAFPRPKVVLLDKGTVKTLRRRETFDHMTAMDALQVDG